MDAKQIIATLKDAEPALKARGVRHAGLFGSVARGDSNETSDVDILIELDKSAKLTVFDYAGLKSDIAALFEGPVDVVDRDALKPHLRAPLARDLLYAF